MYRLSGKVSLRHRFVFALFLCTGMILVLWFGYHHIAHQAISRAARENTILAANALNARIGAEFAQMQTVTTAIADSASVRVFLKERDVTAYYEKAELVSEIIQNAAFPITSADSVITFGAGGNYFRFSGGLSHDSCEALGQAFQGAGTAYTVIELDHTLFFCHNMPVFDAQGLTPVRIGNVVMLTGLDKTRRMLEDEDTPADIDMAVIFDGIVILSNNHALEGGDADGLTARYSMISSAPVAGTTLTVAAAIPPSALFPENTLFLAMSATLLLILLLVITWLYRYLSGNMIRPMTNIIAHVRAIGGGKPGRLPETGKKDFDALVLDINDMLDRTETYNAELAAQRQSLFDAEMLRKDMRISLLASQMDAHFVVNTLKSIKRLSDIGETGKTGQMADGLAAILQHQHSGDALVNVFDDLQILEQYVDVMNIKFDGKYTVEYDVEDKLEACMMPGLILQPIVENALTHGLQSKAQDARLIIKGLLRDDVVFFTISDNGVGIPPAKLKAIRDSLAGAEIGDFPAPGLRGVALENIQRRIRLRYGAEYGITVESDLGKGTTVTVSLPIVSDR